jgi:Mg2+/citrate symporter
LIAGYETKIPERVVDGINGLAFMVAIFVFAIIFPDVIGDAEMPDSFIKKS